MNSGGAGLEGDNDTLWCSVEVLVLEAHAEGGRTAGGQRRAGAPPTSEAVADFGGTTALSEGTVAAVRTALP